MQIKNLARRRADRVLGFKSYDQSRSLQTIRTIKALLAGGSELEREAPNLGFFHPQDPTLKEKERLVSLTYKGLLSLIRNYYSAFLFNHQLLIDVNAGSKPSWYPEFVSSLDGNSKSFSDLVQECFDLASATQEVAVFASKPVLQEPMALTQSQVESLGLDRVDLQVFDAAEICDYEYDAKGELLWITLDKESFPRSNPLSEATLYQHDWFVIDRTTVKHFQYVSDKGEPLGHDDKEATLVNEYAHGLTRVPVVLLHFEPSRWICGLLKNPVLDCIRARTSKAFYINTCAYPITVIHSDSDAATLQQALTALGPHKIKLGINDKIDRTIPPAEAHTGLAADVADTEKKVFLTVGLSFLADQENGKPWRSGLAKSLDSEQGHKLAADMGSKVREFATRLINLVAELKGDEPNFIVNGFEHLSDLNAGAFVELMAKIAEIQWANVSQIDPEFTKAAKERLTKLVLADEPEERLNRIGQSIRSSTETNATGANPVNSGNQPTLTTQELTSG